MMIFTNHEAINNINLTPVLYCYLETQRRGAYEVEKGAVIELSCNLQ